MGGVFVNYRDDDSRIFAAIIHHDLARRFGADTVFKDNATMRPGERYPDQLRAALDRVDVLVAVLGPRWLDLRHDGVRRIDRPDDWVRLEIRRAFERGIPVIPLLLRDVPENATQPRREDLPADIAELALVQSIDVSVRQLEPDLDRLAERLVDLVPTLAIPTLFTPPPPALAPGDAPSTLLRAEYRVVPFTGRDRELADLRAWAGGSAVCAARLLTGPAGAGKTRLALELVDALTADGWLAGVVDGEASAVHIARTAAVRTPLLAVVDDVELRTSQLAALAGALSERSAPSRLLLLGRAPGAWLDHLRGESAVFRALTTTTLRAAPADPDQQCRAARAAFASTAEVSVPVPATVPTTLEIHSVALAGSPDPAAVLAHDEDQLRAHVPPDVDLDRAATVRAVATLCQPASEAQARAVLSRMPELLGIDTAAVERCRAWLAATYPGRHPLSAAHPNPLGERLVADQLAVHPDVVPKLATTCTDDQLTTALTVLGRALRRHPTLTDAVTALTTADPERLLPLGITATRRLADPEPFVRALANALADADVSPDFAMTLAERVSTEGPDFGPLKAVAARLHTRAMTDPIDQYRQTVDVPEPLVPLQQVAAKMTDLLQDLGTALLDPGSGKSPKNPDGTDMIPAPLLNLFSNLIYRNMPPPPTDERNPER